MYRSGVPLVVGTKNSKSFLSKLQVDTNAQDLEEANRKLRSQSQCDKDTVAALTTSLETAESRVESLETQLSTLMNEQKEKEESDQAEMAKQV